MLTFVHIMAWCRTGDTPLSNDGTVCQRIYCVTLLKWVKNPRRSCKNDWSKRHNSTSKYSVVLIVDLLTFVVFSVYFTLSQRSVLCRKLLMNDFVITKPALTINDIFAFSSIGTDKNFKKLLFSWFDAVLPGSSERQYNQYQISNVINFPHLTLTLVSISNPRSSYWTDF